MKRSRADCQGVRNLDMRRCINLHEPGGVVQGCEMPPATHSSAPHPSLVQRRPVPWWCTPRVLLRVWKSRMYSALHRGHRSRFVLPSSSNNWVVHRTAAAYTRIPAPHTAP